MIGMGRESRKGLWASGLLATVVMLLGVQGAEAQDQKPASEADAPDALVGTVVDAETGAPLAGAFVLMDGYGWGTLSAADGSFTLPGVGTGQANLMVEQLGYIPLQQNVVVKEGGEAVVLRVQPDPVILAGITGVIDRLEQRRASAATSSWVFDRKDLVVNVGFDALAFLESRTPIQLFPCNAGSECAYVQGRVVPVSIFVDEMPFLGGMTFLQAHQPFELQRIEVFAGGRHIRIYTEDFLKRAGRSGFRPAPFIL